MEPRSAKFKYTTTIAAKIGFVYWFFWATTPIIMVTLFEHNMFYGSAFVTIVTFTTFSFTLSVYTLMNGRNTKKNYSKIPTGAKYLFCFIALSGASMFWRQSGPTLIALAYWVRLVLETAIPLILCRLDNPNAVAVQSLKGLVAGSAAFAIGTLILVEESGYRFGSSGGLLHSNPIGNQLALAIIICIFLLWSNATNRHQKFIYFVLGTICSYVFIISFSKSSIAAFMFSIFAFLALARIKVRSKITLSAVIFALIIFSYGFIYESWSKYLDAGYGGAALDTLTGRTVIWRYTWNKILDAIIFGHGFLAFRDFPPEFGFFKPNQAHNEVLQVWYTLGISGVILWALMYFSLAKQIVSTGRARTYGHPRSLAIALLAYMLVRGVAEGDSVALIFPLPLLLLIFIWLPSYSSEKRTALNTDPRAIRASAIPFGGNHSPPNLVRP